MKKDQSKLKQLDELYETGAINEEEYETLKSELGSDKKKKWKSKGFILDMVQNMTQSRIDKVTPLIIEGSPELKRAAEKADKSNQEFRKAADRAYKSITGKKRKSTAEKRKECDVLSNESNTYLDNVIFPDYETEQKLEEKNLQIKSLEYILQEIELKLSYLLLQSFTNKDNYLSGEIWNPY